MFNMSDWTSPFEVSSFLVILIVLATTVRIISRKKLNLPPGPINLPIVGHLPFLIGKSIDEVFSDFSAKYGNVVYLQLGANPVVILSSYDAIQEALLFNPEIATVRPGHFSTLNYIMNEKGARTPGLIVENGKIWQDQRRFFLRTFRALGFGKQNLESEIQEEALVIVKVFQDQIGKPFDPHQTLVNATANIISALLFGFRYNYGDPEYHELLHTFLIGPSRMSPFALVNFFPYIRFILPPFLSGLAEVNEIKRILHPFMVKKVQEHQISEGSTHDYTSIYMKQQKEDLANGYTNTPFTDERLHSNVLALSGAGITTTASTINSALKLLIKYPEFQKKVQDEIDGVIGVERTPSYYDRPKMPYTDAFIMEVQRYCNVVPLGLPYAANKDTKLAGYDIPKGTTIMTNLSAVHSNSKLWGDPENFRPERFIGEDGKTKLCDYLIPFAIGKRSCPGENLAMMEVFVFLSSILQKFTFTPCSIEDTNLDFKDSITRDVSPFKLFVQSRQHCSKC